MTTSEDQVLDGIEGRVKLGSRDCHFQGVAVQLSQGVQFTQGDSGVEANGAQGAARAAPTTKHELSGEQAEATPRVERTSVVKETKKG